MKSMFAALSWLVVLSGCSAATTLYGAKTLEPRQYEGVFAISVLDQPDPITDVLAEGPTDGEGLPFGLKADYGGRIGVHPDFDVGWRIYTVGVGADVRYRFYRNDRLHLATAPGFVYSALPPIKVGNTTEDTFSVGLVEFHAPLLAEFELTRWWSISGGPRLILRDSFQTVKTADLSDSGNRLDVLGTAGVRTEFHSRTFGLAFTGDYTTEPIRRGAPHWAASIQFVMRTDPYRNRLERAAKKTFTPRVGGAQ